MLGNFSFFLAITVAIVLITMLAEKARIAYPVLLVVAGLAISFIPGIPEVHVEPDLIFLIFLPPLLNEAAWTISWKEIWRWRRIITSFAFIVVFLTAISVAFVANAFIPGFSLALGFLLGGIVSPPDAVSVNAVLKFVKIPKRMSSILQGESLLNDASSLIIFRFALIAVATGQFIWYESVLSFSWMIAGGVGIGLLGGFIFMKAHKYLPTNVNIDVVLTFLAPYILYIAAEEVESSGVLAVVTAGLLLSKNRHSYLSNSSLLKGVNVWESFIFLLNGLVFMLIGLELPEIVAGLPNVSIPTAIGYGLLISFVVIVVRLLSYYGAIIVTLIMKNFITVADEKSPGLKVPFIMGWAGMRGVLSLAAALSIPLYLDDKGTHFPQRNLILFITFIVILVTLLLQGLTLPYFIRKIKLPAFDDYISEEETNKIIKQKLASSTIEFMDDHYMEEFKNNTALQHVMKKWQYLRDEDNNKLPENTKLIYLEALTHQRKCLVEMTHADNRYDEDILQQHIHQIDLEEEKIKNYY